ncbi:MAG: decarboxylase [Candidatus Woesearchaeota archaeon]
MAKFILSRKKVLEQYDKVEKVADIVSYSSKTNPDVTKILEEETKCMFSIHLTNELVNIRDKSRVLFLAQAWDKDLIQELMGEGIKNFVIDNESDLEILLKFLDETKVKVNLLLRIKLRENTIRTEKYFVFGMPSEFVNEKIKELKKNENIEKLGVHFHRKTQNMSEWNLRYEISNILDEDIISMIDIVNIGGGLPSIYANTNEDVIRTVFDKIKDFRQWLAERDIQIMIEPGRFIAAPAVKLVTKIIAIYENNIIVDASVYNTDMDAVIVPVKLLVEGELDKNEGKAYVIKGKTPCSMDLFRYRVYLDNPKVGDEIVFLNAGAYNFSSDFCDLKKLETGMME